MSLDSIISFFRQGPTHPPAHDPALADAQLNNSANDRVRAPHIAKLGPPARPQPSADPSDANRPLGPVDSVRISTQATYVIAASQFDPTAISESQTQRLIDGLVNGKAISNRDRAIIARGPETAPALTDQNAARNLLADFQNDLNQALGRNDFRTVETSSRAVSILGRVASLREIIT